VTGDGCLVFPAKLLLYFLSIGYSFLENNFPEVNKPQTHLLMSYNSIRTMAGCIFNHQKSMNWVTDDGFLVGVYVELLLYSLPIGYFFMAKYFS